MKKPAFLYALVFGLALVSVPGASAQESNEYAECAAVLASPPFVDILTRNEGHDFYEIAYPKNAQKLVGLECSVDELTEFFETAGWEFERLTENSLTGPFGVPGAKYYSDASAHYCLKRPTLFGMFDYRCRPIARIDFYEGRISNLGAYTNK